MIDEIFKANEEARAYRHPKRAMRITMECGHLKLIPWNLSAAGIGASTGCLICPDHHPTRLVVNIEETGVLDESFFKGAKL